MLHLKISALRKKMAMKYNLARKWKNFEKETQKRLIDFIYVFLYQSFLLKWLAGVFFILIYSI